MNGIIIYKSKYGASRKYAQWIKKETGFRCIDVDKVRVKALQDYDTIIIGGGVYASGVPAFSFLKKHIDQMAGKKILTFCCGASPFDQKFFDELRGRIFTDKLEGIPCFYFRGGFDMKNMTFKDRTLCRMLRKMVAKKDPSDYEVWEEAMMSVGEDEAGDWTDRASIRPLLEALAE
jgi:menaquinone-dependent protoporphyrinogen IX oxidase